MVLLIKTKVLCNLVLDVLKIIVIHMHYEINILVILLLTRQIGFR